MATKKADDPFDDEDFSNDELSTVSDEVPDASMDDSRVPWLKPVMLKQRQGTMELVSLDTNGTEYSDVVLHVKFNGKPFGIGLRTFSKDYQSLLKRFGKKKEAWHGQLKYKVMPHKGNPNGFIAVR